MNSIARMVVPSVAAAALIVGLVGCGSGGGGTVAFGTGLDSSHTVKGQKSTFARSESMYWTAGLKDMVAERTITLDITNAKGRNMEHDAPLIKNAGATKANDIWAGPVNLASWPPDTYTFKVTSGGKEEATGNVTITK